MLRTLPRVFLSICGVALGIAATSTPARAGEPTPAPEPGADAAPEPTEVETPEASEPRKTDAASSKPRGAHSYYWVDDRSRPPLPYRGDVAVPEGYRLDSQPNTGLLVAGITTTATLWTVSTIAAIALDEQADTFEGDPNFDDMYWPMFIPVVGPFITIKTADSSGTGAAILGLNGVLQTAGIGMLIAGIALPKVEIVPQRPINIAPVASADSVGVDISGAF